MSELKAILATPHPKMKNSCDGAIEVYLKSEADKVIADLKDKLQKESALLKETREWLIESQKMHKRCADNAARIIRRSDHKRCLDKADMNWWQANRYSAAEMVERIRGNFEEAIQCSKLEEKYLKRYNIWLALAEEPTWAKFLQLIHKETK